jgi:hypothetical protein
MNHMQPGDIVVRDKGAFRHLGIVVNEGMVLHNTPELGEHISTMDAFCQGKPYRVIQIPSALRWVVLANASRIAAYPRRYDAVSNNCEHTVTRALGEQPHSSQIAILLTLCIGAALLYIVSKAK